MPPGKSNHNLNMWLSKSPKKAINLGSHFFLVPFQCSSKSHCVKQHVHRLGVHTKEVQSEFPEMHLAGSPSSLLLGCSLQCVFITVSHHSSSLKLWEQCHLLPTASHFFFFFLLCSWLYNRESESRQQPSLRYYFSGNQCSFTNTWLFFLSEISWIFHWQNQNN